jgi:hypothetical protein
VCACILTQNWEYTCGETMFFLCVCGVGWGGGATITQRKSKERGDMDERGVKKKRAGQVKGKTKQNLNV